MTEKPGEYEEAEAHLKVVEQLWSLPLMSQLKEQLPSVSLGNVLVAEARTGLVPMLWAQSLPESIRVMALDPSRSMLDLARDRFDEAAQKRIFLTPQSIQSLSYADGVFPAAVCTEGIITQHQLVQGLTELTRVVDQGGSLLLCVPSVHSFGICVDMMEEAFAAHELEHNLERLEQLQRSFLTSDTLYRVARELGLHDLSMQHHRWTIEFDSGHELLTSPLIRQTFFPHWMSIIRSSERDLIVRYMIDALDTYFHGQTIPLEVDALSILATR